jgi:hypothetical protein
LLDGLFEQPANRPCDITTRKITVIFEKKLSFPAACWLPPLRRIHHAPAGIFAIHSAHSLNSHSLASRCWASAASYSARFRKIAPLTKPKLFMQTLRLTNIHLDN